MIRISEDRLMADIAGQEPHYVDAVGGCVNLGANFGAMYYRWVPVPSAGEWQFEPIPALYIIRPRASLWTPGTLAAMLDRQRPPIGPPSIIPMAH